MVIIINHVIHFIEKEGGITDFHFNLRKNIVTQTSMVPMWPTFVLISLIFAQNSKIWCICTFKKIKFSSINEIKHNKQNTDKHI